MRIRRLFAVVMLSGAFSLLSALLFVTLDAVDVAFTEAAVGAGISTVLMLSTIALTARTETKSASVNYTALFVSIVTGSVLIYATLDMPGFGDISAPIHNHVVPDYLQRIPHEIGIPNIVTAILASYRGFDTMGEVVVVFTAGIGVILILGLSRHRPLAQSATAKKNTGKDDSEES